MKKKILLLITFLLFLPVITNAEANLLKYKGLEVGAGVSSWAGEDYIYYSGDFDVIKKLSYRMDINVGLFVGFKLSNSFVVQTELFYASKGIKIPLSNDFGNYTFKTDYIEFPISIIRFFGKENKFQIGPFVGTGVSFLVRNDFEIQIGDQRERIKLDKYNKTDIVVVGGLKFIIPFNQRIMHLDFRTSLGLRNIFSEFQDSISQYGFVLDETTNLKNVQFSLTLGFPL